MLFTIAIEFRYRVLLIVGSAYHELKWLDFHFSVSSVQVWILSRIPSVVVVERIFAINICWKQWKDCGMFTAYDAPTVERRLTKANVSFATKIFFARLTFFGEHSISFICWFHDFLVVSRPNQWYILLTWQFVEGKCEKWNFSAFVSYLKLLRSSCCWLTSDSIQLPSLLRLLRCLIELYVLLINGNI